LRSGRVLKEVGQDSPVLAKKGQTAKRRAAHSFDRIGGSVPAGGRPIMLRGR